MVACTGLDGAPLPFVAMRNAMSIAFSPPLMSSFAISATLPSGFSAYSNTPTPFMRSLCLAKIVCSCSGVSGAPEISDTRTSYSKLGLTNVPSSASYPSVSILCRNSSSFLCAASSGTAEPSSPARAKSSKALSRPAYVQSRLFSVPLSRISARSALVMRDCPLHKKPPFASGS